MHRLALKMQVLEESDTHAIEAEAVRPLTLSPRTRLAMLLVTCGGYGTPFTLGVT